MEDLVTDAVLGGSQVFIDGRVGDIGNGGISSVGEESAGREPDNDGRDNENDIRIDAREAFF